MDDQITCRIWCDKASYRIVGNIKEVEKVISWALEPGTTRTPFVYFNLAELFDEQVCINAHKVSSIEPA